MPVTVNYYYITIITDNIINKGHNINRLAVWNDTDNKASFYNQLPYQLIYYEVS